MIWRILGHVAQFRVAQFWGWAAIISGAVWATTEGLPGLILGAAGFALARLARPSPDSALDRATGRNPDSD